MDIAFKNAASQVFGSQQQLYLWHVGNNTQRRRGGGSSRGATTQITRQVEEIQGNITGIQNTVVNLKGILRQFLQNQYQ